MVQKKLKKTKSLNISDFYSAADYNSAEVRQRFGEKRKFSVLLSESYKRIGKSGDSSYLRRSDRVSECGTYLEFRKSMSDMHDESVPFKLWNANFCRERLCPLCSWRRSMKIFGQVSRIMDFMGDDLAYIFLTLTVPNCEGDQLSALIDDLQNGFHKLVNYKRFRTAVFGFFRALEVTRNKDLKSYSYGTYHPHFHCILAVRKRYFKEKEYISHDEWLAMWRKAMKNPAITQVDVRRVRPKDMAAGEETAKLLSDRLMDLKAGVAEVAKYTVKASDYIYEHDAKLTDEVVFTMSEALRGRRLCAFGGVFEDIRKQLQLDDAEDGDLIHVGDDETLRADVAYMVRKYQWSAGAYKLYDVHVEHSDLSDPLAEGE